MEILPRLEYWSGMYASFALSLSYHLHFVTLQEPRGKSSRGDQKYIFNSVFKQKVEVVFNVSDTSLEIAPRINTIYRRA
jgi:hypothetical protein